MSGTPDWRIAGEWFDNCSCAIACPCTFGQAPDNDLCEFVLFWHIAEGHYGDVALDGLSFVRVGSFDGNLWDHGARGRSGAFIDDRANDVQADALMEIFSGRAGGWPRTFSDLMSGGRESLGVERAAISFEIAPDQSRWGLDIAGRVKAWAEALSGPTSTPGEPPRMSSAPGSETGPGQMVTWGRSTICNVDAFGVEFSWTVSSAKHIPFDWSSD